MGARSGALPDRVDPREFPHGSHQWCQHREREHTRLALMCLMLEIFERRLLGRWEREHGRAAQRKRQALTLASLATTSEELLAINSKATQEALSAEWRAAEKAANELISMEEREATKKSKKAKKQQARNATHAVKLQRGYPVQAVVKNNGEDKRNVLNNSGGVDREIEGAAAEDADGEDMLEQKIQEVQARVDAEDGDEIDAEFNRLVLEHLKARSARAEDEVVDTQKSATVIKKLCQKMEEGLASAMSK